MTKVLELKNLNVTYVNKKKRVHAVRNVSFSIDKGDSLGIVGESGSGKSTLAMAVLGLLPKRSTEITGEAEFLEKYELLTLDQKTLNKLRWKEIAVVFQKAMNSLSPVHRIRTMCEDVHRVHEPKATNEEIRANFMRLLKLVYLPERVYDLYPHEMSGGMLQRVAIALSLMFNPKLLIFDEATTALDVVTQGQILDEVVQMEDVLETTRIMITHDMSVVASSCKKIAVMYAGELLEFGPVTKSLVEPYHPYTQALLRSFPSLKGENERLESIPGRLPDLSKEMKGCVFAPRCPFAGPRCHKEKPSLIHVNEDCQAACFLHNGGVQ